MVDNRTSRSNKKVKMGNVDSCSIDAVIVRWFFSVIFLVIIITSPLLIQYLGSAVIKYILYLGYNVKRTT